MPAVTYALGAWMNCSSLTSFPLIDLSAVTTVQQAWLGCAGLTTFPPLNLAACASFSLAWTDCTSLTSFGLVNITAGTGFGSAWFRCSSLVNFPANLFDSWTGTPSPGCFSSAWKGCTSLSATSVEHILNSIDTSGQSAPSSGTEITIDYNENSGAPNISTAVANLKSRGWTIKLNDTFL